jgi:ABC-type phosphate/phosphonate transport system ATPase subunit
VNAVRLRGLHVGYGMGPDVVRGVDLDVPEGGSLAILGPSGGGKSTLLKTLAGLLMPRRGTLDVLGHAWPERPPAGSVGYVPQRLGLVRHATVLENAMQGALHDTPMWRMLLRRPDAEVTERAYEALESVGLAEKAHVAVHRLSGGQQRRAAVARTLVQRPRLLLADEFLGELDPVTVDMVVGAVQHLQRKTGMSAVFVEHHIDQARRIAANVRRMDGGILHEITEAA